MDGGHQSVGETPTIVKTGFASVDENDGSDATESDSTKGLRAIRRELDGFKDGAIQYHWYGFEL